MKSHQNGKNAQSSNGEGQPGSRSSVEIGNFVDSRGRRSIRISHPEACHCAICVMVRDRQRTREEFLAATRRDLAVEWNKEPDPKCACDICASDRESKRLDAQREPRHLALRVLAEAILAGEFLDAIGEMSTAEAMSRGLTVLDCIEAARGRIREIQTAASAIIDLG